MQFHHEYLPAECITNTQSQKTYLAIQSQNRKKRYCLDETASSNILMGGNTVIVLAQKELPRPNA